MSIQLISVFGIGNHSIYLHKATAHHTAGLDNCGVLQIIRMYINMVYAKVTCKIDDHYGKLNFPLFDVLVRSLRLSIAKLHVEW